MSDKLKQSMSAAVDDEADEFELRRVIDELDRDPDLRAAWERYHLVGSVLRREQASASAGLRDRVWQSLMEEADPVAESTPGGAPGDAGVEAPVGAGGAQWLGFGPRAGIAVAASVAFAVVLGVALLDSDVLPEQPIAQSGAPLGGAPLGGAQLAGAQIPGAQIPGAEQVAPQSGLQTRAPAFATGTPVLREPVVAPSADVRLAADVSPSDLRRARAYMLHHTQQQALNQAGVVNFVKMATYEGQ